MCLSAGSVGAGPSPGEVMWWWERQATMSATTLCQALSPSGSLGRGPTRCSSQFGWSPASWWVAASSCWRIARVVMLTSSGAAPWAVTVAHHWSRRRVLFVVDALQRRFGARVEWLFAGVAVDDGELFPREFSFGGAVSVGGDEHDVGGAAGVVDVVDGADVVAVLGADFDAGGEVAGGVVDGGQRVDELVPVGAVFGGGEVGGAAGHSESGLEGGEWDGLEFPRVDGHLP